MHPCIKDKRVSFENSSITPAFEDFLLSVQALNRAAEILPYSAASQLFFAQQQHSTTSREQGEWQIKELFSFQQQFSCVAFRRSPRKFRISPFLCYSPPYLHVPAAVHKGNLPKCCLPLKLLLSSTSWKRIPPLAHEHLKLG